MKWKPRIKTGGNLNGMNVISMQNNNFSNAHSSGYDDDDGSVRSSGVDEFLMCWAISFCEIYGAAGWKIKVESLNFSSSAHTNR